MIKVVKDTKDINSFIDMHYNAFKGYLTGRLGKEYVSYFLTSLITSKEGVFYTHSEDDKILGFICGTTDITKFWNKEYRRKLWKLAIIIILKNPLTAFNMLRHIWVQHQVDKCEMNARILSLVISEECRGRGMGRRLVETFSSFMARQGVKNYLVYTDADCPASKFYHKMGFRLVKTINFFGYRINCFIYDLFPDAKGEKGESICYNSHS